MYVCMQNYYSSARLDKVMQRTLSEIVDKNVDT